MYYVIGARWDDVNGIASKQNAKVYRTTQNNVAKHRRFSALLFGKLKRLADRQGAGLIDQYDLYDYSTYITMKSSIYLQLVPDLDKIFAECVKTFNMQELARETATPSLF